MPEYLSPGVFIEEIPARLQAIEGVSTSTAGLVGEAERGPVAGFLPPGITPGFVRPDTAPILVTSLAQYRRTFGAPPDDPAVNGYLGHAAQAFFANGGKRAFIARAARPGATPAFHRVDQGAVLRLTREVRAGETTIFLNSLRGVDTTATLSFIGAQGAVLAGPIAVVAANTRAGSVTLASAPGAFDPAQVAVSSSLVTSSAGAGPQFWARSPGSWGASLRILVSASDRPPVPVTAAIGSGGSSTLQLASTATFYIGAVVEIDDGAGHRLERRVVDLLPGATLLLDTAVASITTSGFAQVAEIDVTITDSRTGAVETYAHLSWNGNPAAEIRRRHYSTVINSRSTLVFAQPSWAGLPGGAVTDEDPPSMDNQPSSAFGFPVGPDPAVAAELGGDGPVPANRSHVIGVDNGPGQRTGIQSLQDVDDIRIIAAPGETDRAVQNELITQAETLRYRFAVLDGIDPAPGSTTVVNDLLTHRNAYDTSFAAYYVPWLQSGAGDQSLLLPPSGHVIGVYARTDNERGVWKAPANEVVRGITGMRSYITTGEQDILNPRGVNAIRQFEGRGIRVWGARTLSSTPEYRYVNVRRFLIFMEASIHRGTQWVVFEPNSPDTWSRVVDSVTALLHTQWRAGALLGRKPEDAFYVRCDETTMTADDIQNGRLICDIGVAIVKPAEFVIFRIEQLTGFGNKA